MDVMHARCAGLDVHQKTVVACARLASGGTVTHEVQTFGTTTRELLVLAEWLAGRRVTHVAMESTGVFWKPVWHILDGQFELVLANARHLRHIPDRKFAGRRRRSSPSPHPCSRRAITSSRTGSTTATSGLTILIAATKPSSPDASSGGFTTLASASRSVPRREPDISF
jgi:transposase